MTHFISMKICNWVRPGVMMGDLPVAWPDIDDIGLTGYAKNQYFWLILPSLSKKCSSLKYCPSPPVCPIQY